MASGDTATNDKDIRADLVFLVIPNGVWPLRTCRIFLYVFVVRSFSLEILAYGTGSIAHSLRDDPHLSMSPPQIWRIFDYRLHSAFPASRPPGLPMLSFAISGIFSIAIILH